MAIELQKECELVNDVGEGKAVEGLTKVHCVERNAVRFQIGKYDTRLPTKENFRVPAIDNLNTFAPATTTTTSPTLLTHAPCHDIIRIHQPPVSTEAESRRLSQLYKTPCALQQSSRKWYQISSGIVDHSSSLRRVSKRGILIRKPTNSMYIVIIHINNLAVTPTTFKHLEAQTILLSRNSCIQSVTYKPPYAPPDPRSFLIKHQDLSTTEEFAAVTDKNPFREV
jgi:hypothetical protein